MAEKPICSRLLVRSSEARCPLLPPASIVNDLRESDSLNRPLSPSESSGLATLMATVIGWCRRTRAVSNRWTWCALVPRAFVRTGACDRRGHPFWASVPAIFIFAILFPCADQALPVGTSPRLLMTWAVTNTYRRLGLELTEQTKFSTFL
jgi:hypothetical protein